MEVEFKPFEYNSQFAQTRVTKPNERLLNKTDYVTDYIKGVLFLHKFSIINKKEKEVEQQIIEELKYLIKQQTVLIPYTPKRKPKLGDYDYIPDVD